jgi:hypothetical protein
MDNQSGEEIEIRDFASNNDVRPVSDPNIFSETQRLAQAQAILQLASSAPQLYDLRQAHLRVLRQMKIPNIEDILPNPDGVKESNPALENVSMAMGRAAAAYPDQDHLAHIKVHLTFAMDPNYGSSPIIGPAYAPHLLEHLKQHITLHYLQSMRDYVGQASGDGEDVFKLNEVIKNVHMMNPPGIKGNGGVVGSAFFMSGKKFRALPPATQKMLVDLRNEYGVRYATELMKAEEQIKKKWVDNNKITFAYSTPADEQRIAQAGVAANEAYFKKLEGEGATNVRKVVTYYTDSRKKLEAAAAKK